MKILVACEFSGAVRDAFINQGHDAWSCDFEASEGEHASNHIVGDARLYLGEGWDLLVAHPPCTRLCNSGVRWLYERDLWREFGCAIGLFNDFWNCNISKIAVENPIPHKYANYYIGHYSQIVHPWMFGHGETKSTCLWLKNLPKLTATDPVRGREHKVHTQSPGPDRWKERSRTYSGLALAMAKQWGQE